jgi:quercetin dioxygenase-like cupin family protein
MALDGTAALAVPQYNWDTIPEREMRPGVTQKVFRGDNVVIGLTTLHPGMQTAPHRHPWEQLFTILKGRIVLHIEEQVFDCPAGTMIRIPPNALHWGEGPTVEDGPALNLDVWYPLRPDYAKFTQYQTDQFSPDAAGV